MRRMIEPPPTSKCVHCNSTLKLKRIELSNLDAAVATHVFACGDCGREYSVSSLLDQHEAADFRRPAQLLRGVGFPAG